MILPTATRVSDDAVALLLALAAPERDIEAVTTYGSQASRLAHVVRPGRVTTTWQTWRSSSGRSRLVVGRSSIPGTVPTRPANGHVAVGLDVPAFFDLLVERIATLG